ncbi:anaphase-promoting complex subunit 4 [Geosmithia morbida]|uniref:Anaphase-promoting complex subunit 4 n=1 Tax=Geosmithia morbida TaxID=1094350 RepID=A0A9P4YWT3_9HYPO|nr:anaphase-promoting complex subunit 4 [Geosmithia morbida]KAF4123247.1 anaphase-promoting complex subunit 4 [Geosmithia morbida]
MTRQLTFLSETEFDSKVPDGFPVSCPTLDLSATRESGRKNVLILRPPSQTVSRIHQLGSKAPEPLAVAWKTDDQFLAVGWSDGVVRLMGLENNKAVHHIEICPQSSDAKITHISWSCTRISDPTHAQTKTSALDVSPPELGGRPLADLPRELTFLEIDTALPKISPLPGSSAGSGEDALVFTLRTSIDFLFRAPRPDEYDQVNVMIVGSSDGRLHLSVYDSFVIGSFPCPPLGPTAAASPPPPQLIHIASSPRISTHALLLADRNDQPDEVHLVPMDLPFISSVPINLSLLASKLTTLQKLLRYLKQTQLHMQLEWKNTRELPSRFLRSAEAGLEDLTGGPRTVVAALYHTVVTGHAYEPVREWLVDSLAERGHKRWDKAVVAGLENLRSLVHENFLPALERCSIILSRLRGLAQFHDDREDIGFTVPQISKVMDIIGCLTLVGHRVLLAVMNELEHFTAFSRWLRFQIDRLASSTPESEELSEKEATMDMTRVLTYIERYLTDSPMRLFLGDMTDEDRAADWKTMEDGAPDLMDMLSTQLVRHEKSQDGMKALPRVEFLVDYATHWSNSIFKDIAESKKRSVRLGKPVKLSIGNKIDKIDMCMCEHSDGEAFIYTALSSKDASNKVYIFRAGLSITRGISSNGFVESAVLDLGNSKLIDLGFMSGSQELVVLCAASGGLTHAMAVPVKSDSLDFQRFDSATGVVAAEAGQAADSFATYTLPSESLSGVKPVRMQVHDRVNARGELAARIYLLGSNRTTWQAFTWGE